MQVKATGEIERWPKLMEKTADYCTCFAPIRQELLLWGTAQCLKCGRKLP